MAEAETDGFSTVPPPTDVIKTQQEFYEMFGHQSAIIYDCYATKETLEMKINLMMPQIRASRRRMLIDIIWEQKKFTGNNCLMMSPIFITCIYDKTNIKERLTYPLDIKSNQFSVHPVFRVQKCADEFRGSANCCAVFIDEFARVYMNWTDFREKNKYENSLILAPRNGIYNGSADDKVYLDIFLKISGITENLDKGSTVLGLASAGVAAITFIPAIAVAPVVVAGAAVAGVSCAIYTGLRSVYDLMDRRSHKQSIGIKDKEARSSWINVAAGTVTAGATGVTQMVARAAQGGQTMAHLARTAHLLNIGALGLNTTGCLDGLHTMVYKLHDGEDITLKDVSKFSALLFILTHSVKNLQTAEKILNLQTSSDAQSADIKLVLCEAQKLAFDILVKETLLIRGVEQEIGQIVVRSFKSMCSPKEVLENTEKIVKHFVKERAETRLIESPSIEEVSSATESSGTEEATSADVTDDDDLEKLKKQHCGDSLSPYIKTEYCDMFDARVDLIVTSLAGHVKHKNKPELKIAIISILEELSLKVFDIFLNFVEEFVVKNGPTIEKKLNQSIYFEYFIQIIFKQLKILGEGNGYSNVKDYILSLSDEARQIADYEIRKYFVTIKSEDIQQLTAQNENRKSDLSEDDKVRIIIDDQIELFVKRLKRFCKAVSLNDLRETIKDVLKSLSYGSAVIFFDIAEALIQKYSTLIQHCLGRFIPLDIFISDIYCIVREISEKDGHGMNEYLFQYTNDMFEIIEEKFNGFYNEQNITDGKNVKRCPHCTGLHIL